MLLISAIEDGCGKEIEINGIAASQMDALLVCAAK